ncbi:hypothetical protein MTR_4g065103 [Medicago truncatula]|uniref:Uncharacterized protein n=1 Tax=Medicago truncatula TaxID=3880 RepID=A0A072UKE9_MEDTR|nr:hypothetical protein MTR_4g065103 [Medicago truncatula]
MEEVMEMGEEETSKYKEAVVKGIKLKIARHVVQSFSRKCLNVHHSHSLLYEQDD